MYSASRGIHYTAPPGLDDENEDRATKAENRPAKTDEPTESDDSAVETVTSAAPESLAADD